MLETIKGINAVLKEKGKKMVVSFKGKTFTAVLGVTR